MYAHDRARQAKRATLLLAYVAHSCSGTCLTIQDFLATATAVLHGSRLGCGALNLATCIPYATPLPSHIRAPLFF